VGTRRTRIDPGHGGGAEVGGSSHNNALSPSGVPEKNLTLRMGTNIADPAGRSCAVYAFKLLGRHLMTTVKGAM
jgi:hypothetical protein